MKHVATGCVCAVPRVPRTYGAQKKLTGTEMWQCPECLQLWRLSVPPNLRTADPRWVRSGKNMATIAARHKLAAVRQAESEAWERRAAGIAARMAQERATRARRHRAGAAYTPGQRVAYRARYGRWRAWLKPTVEQMLAERNRILRAEGTVRAAGASEDQPTNEGNTVKTLAKLIVVGTGAMMVVGIGAAALTMSGALPTTPGIVVVDDGTIAPSQSDAAPVTLADAWLDMSRADRKAACKSPYAGATKLSSVTNESAGTSVAFVRLVCK